MNETTQATSTNQVAQLHAVVDYLPGITIVGAESALLEWTADNRIKFFKMNFETNQATEVLFDVALSEIQEVIGSTVMLTFKIADKKYNAQFSQTGMAALGAGGAIGVALSAADAQKAGIYPWVNKLKENGVNVVFRGFRWAFKWAAIVVGAILVAVIGYVVIAG